MKDKKQSRVGSSLDDLLKEEGLFEELEAAAIKEVARSGPEKKSTHRSPKKPQ